MITEKQIDIFKADIQAIIHQANCHSTMGAGIALALRKKWKEVFAADVSFTLPINDRLGRFSIAYINDATSPVKYVFNMYGQLRYGYNHRYTNYEAVAKGLNGIKDFVHESGDIKTVGIPYGMGCNLAGGDWRVVRAIIDSTFEDARFDILICKNF